MHQKNAAALALTAVKNEDQREFAKLVDSFKSQFNEGPRVQVGCGWQRVVVGCITCDDGRSDGMSRGWLLPDGVVLLAGRHAALVWLGVSSSG